MFDWPPNWTLFFAIVTFLAASVAVRSWRELGPLVLLTLLLVLPVKWIGPLLGLQALGQDAITFGERSAKVEATPAVVGAVVIAALAIIAGKEFLARRRKGG